MSKLQKITTLSILLAILTVFPRHGETVTYVTDTGGYAYDESRAVTNLAPAIALGTVAIVGIIAIAVQNSHDHSSSSSSSHYGSSYSSSSHSSSSYSNSYYSHY